MSVQPPLPSIGLELYQLGVHIRAKKQKTQCLSGLLCGHYKSLNNVFLSRQRLTLLI